MPNPDLSAIIAAARAKTEARPKAPDPAMIESERAKCAVDPIYFIETYCHIYDNDTAQWIPFTLWPAQRDALSLVMISKFLIILKSRQEGLTWLVGDCFTVWNMLFKPIAEVLLFSQRDDEAKKILDRIKGTYERLPSWMKQPIVANSEHEFRIGNGSGVQALPASAGGRSNAATLVVIDEADFIDGLQSLISSAKPTIDAGQNKMIVLSTVNEDTPNSFFQRFYTNAKEESTEWKTLFLGWMAHPGRTVEWYDRQCADALKTTGSLDTIYKHYPATDIEALSARTQNVRFYPSWLAECYRQLLNLPNIPDAPAIPGLRIYRAPEAGASYCGGADPAQGNPNSDDSAIEIVDAITGEEVASLAAKVEPTTFADYIAQLSAYYFNAPFLIERNNHGGTVLAEMRNTYTDVPMRTGLDGKPGWFSTDKANTQAYNHAAETIRDQRPVIHNYETYAQLASIGAVSLEAPEGKHDDRADAWVLAHQCAKRGGSSMVQVPYVGLYNNGGWDYRTHVGFPALSSDARPLVDPVGNLLPQERPLQLDLSGRPIQIAPHHNDNNDEMKSRTKGRW